MESKKSHWEKVFETKTPNEVSWTQKVPQTSIDLVVNAANSKDAKIIDIGGGDSNLVDFLIDLGYTNLTVLDISGKALERCRKRLGEKAEKVTWIESDITEFKPTEVYDVWHDRAAFHFLTDKPAIDQYVALVNNYADELIIGTFSENGPIKCSGLEISQYNSDKMAKTFSQKFSISSSLLEDHTTPFETKQNFLFCSLTRLK